MSTAAKPRFGLVGTGIWARMVHAPSAATNDAVTFTAVFGRREEAAAALANEFGATPFTALAPFLEAVDIVGLSLPPDVQAEFALAAIAAGKHVLLEKPVSRDAAVACGIADRLADNGLRSAVFFTHLFIPPVRRWIDEAKSSGGWISARAESFLQVLVDAENPFHATVWRADAGGLWDLTPHSIAVLSAALGNVEHVSAIRGSGDLVTMTLSHQQGAISTVSATLQATAALPGGIMLFGAAGANAPPPIPDWTMAAREAYGVALSALADPAPSEPILADARFGSHVTAVLAAAQNSIDTGRRIRL